MQPTVRARGAFRHHKLPDCKCPRPRPDAPYGLSKLQQCAAAPRAGRARPSRRFFESHATSKPALALGNASGLACRRNALVELSLCRRPTDKPGPPPAKDEARPAAASLAFRTASASLTSGIVCGLPFLARDA